MAIAKVNSSSGYSHVEGAAVAHGGYLNPVSLYTRSTYGTPLGGFNASGAIYRQEIAPSSFVWNGSLPTGFQTIFTSEANGGALHYLRVNSTSATTIGLYLNNDSSGYMLQSGAAPFIVEENQITRISVSGAGPVSVLGLYGHRSY